MRFNDAICRKIKTRKGLFADDNRANCPFANPASGLEESAIRLCLCQWKGRVNACPTFTHEEPSLTPRLRLEPFLNRLGCR